MSAVQSLVHRWRPQRFDQVVGQDHVVRTLRHALAQGRIPQALLFAGPRGVGKTSVARIVAKALNCLQGPTPDPCGCCSLCEEIAAGRCVDVLEIDGASHTGVDDVRELREGMRYLPARGRYRVYIVDEVHMLSLSAFNALLKAIEEPPPHVVFVFATTEPHKLPPTVISRCQRFNFRRIPPSLLEDHLRQVAQREGIGVEAEALRLLAREAAGSLRDGEVLLEQLASYGQGQVTLEALQDVLGLVAPEMIRQLAEALVQRDARECLRIVERAYAQGHDLRRLYEQLMDLLHQMLRFRLDPERLEPDQELPSGVEALSVEELQRLLELGVSWEEMVRGSFGRIALEAMLARACHLSPLPRLEELVERLERLEGADGERTPADGGRGGWPACLTFLKERDPLVASLLSQARFLGMENGRLRLEFRREFHLHEVEGKRERLLALLQEFFGGVVGLELSVCTIPPPPEETPPTAEALDNPVVQEALEALEGEVVEVIRRGG